MRRFVIPFATLALAGSVLVAPVLAESSGVSSSQDAHAAHMAQMEMTTPAKLPTEGGQGAFAAIAEIVAILSADPDTDWSKVDIDALRRHLVDMNELTLNAEAETSVAGDVATFTVWGEGRALRAIHAMVPAHAAELAKLGVWVVSAETTPTGAVLKVSSDDPREFARIKALGFFGIMATGAHHQAHHLAMATGRMPGH